MNLWNSLKCKVFGKCQSLPMHHKVSIGASAYFVVDKSFDVAREHVFLVFHDIVEHAHLIAFTVPAAAALIVISLVGSMFMGHEDKKDTKDTLVNLGDD